jgi:hypothetical protein
MLQSRVRIVPGARADQVVLLPPAPQALREWYEKEGPAMTKLLEQRVGQKGDPIPGINFDLDLV